MAGILFCTVFAWHRTAGSNSALPLPFQSLWSRMNQPEESGNQLDLSPWHTPGWSWNPTVCTLGLCIRMKHSEMESKWARYCGLSTCAQCGVEILNSLSGVAVKLLAAILEGCSSLASTVSCWLDWTGVKITYFPLRGVTISQKHKCDRFFVLFWLYLVSYHSTFVATCNYNHLIKTSNTN